MSERERAIQLLNTVPDNKIAYIIGYIQGLTVEEQDEPNTETLEAFAEVDEMKQAGAGEHFSGATKDLFSAILED
ncbi:MAG: hypothetical protein J6J79_11455 [Lachnospiraceae bacterium]|nr:hypothetical protein [Lachnospiraceae bacterium]